MENATSCVKIDCDWSSNVDGLDINDCIQTSFQKIDLNSQSIDVMGLIEESNCRCVHFTKSGNDNDLLINICCVPNYLIRNILLCSEAKIVELFGKTGEYISTHPAISSEDVEEYPVNSHLIHINSNKCSLKLEQLNNPDFIWIYGIIVYLTESCVEDSCKSLGPINMQNVKHLLDQESLATNAQKLFSLLSLKESKPDIVNSFLSNLENGGLPDMNDGRMISVFNNFKNFEKRVEDKLSTMALQINTISDNVEVLNKKFDTLLNALGKKISL